MSENDGTDHPKPVEVNGVAKTQVAAPEDLEGAATELGGAFQSIKFKGTAGDYFEIWISNLFLSMVTAGVYSAWAKVRRVKYFYNNTLINNFAFNYHATGKQIFKGRMIAFAVLIVYSIVTNIYPLSAIFFAPVFIALAPWIMNRSLRFNARMTSWRNIRLNWHGTYWKTLFLFVLSPLLAMLSLGTLVPWISRAYYRYYAEGHSFGTTRFQSDTKVSQYYMGFLMGLIGPAIVALVVGVIIFVIMSTTRMERTSHVILQVLPYAIGIFVFLAQITFRTICRNIMVQSLTLSDVVSFDSQLRPMKYVWIEISNFVVRIFSLGLLVPWTMVRSYKYLTRNTGVNISDMEHEFFDEELEAMSAFGAEFSDIEGFDVSI